MAELTGFEKPGPIETAFDTLHGRVDGLKSDLASTLDVIIEVAKGERNVDSLRRWVSANDFKLRRKHSLPTRPERNKRPARMRGKSKTK